MHKLYFTRHGETVWNVENKICGMTDSPLTEKGRAQARELGEKLRTSGLRIDEILYSPLSRAADTARAIAEATGIPARCEPRLREQCFGRYEGTPRDGEEFRISKTHFADRYSGGESMMQLAQRIYNLLDELRADTDKTYLLQRAAAGCRWHRFRRSSAGVWSCFGCGGYPQTDTKTPCPPQRGSHPCRNSRRFWASRRFPACCPAGAWCPGPGRERSIHNWRGSGCFCLLLHTGSGPAGNRG